MEYGRNEVGRAQEDQANKFQTICTGLWSGGAKVYNKMGAVKLNFVGLQICCKL